FEKNRHILGFDSPQKALYMIVKEALDNSLDACEEHQIIPEIKVRVLKAENEEFEVTIEDNGPGIDRKEVPKVFGQLLYGSRFHSFKQSRGQQGIGITAAVLFGQITTGKDSLIRTRKKGDEVAYDFKLGINIKENRAKIAEEKPAIWDKEHGTIVTIFSKGKYQTGKQSFLST
ncbi:DNA topoisomerase 6 subunit B, partial [mine drainage metagenome]